MNEWIYRVDENDKVLGKVSFKEAHSNKEIIHRAAHVFIFNSEGKIVLQKRSKSMVYYPDHWESSASGHVDYGESYLDAARRELNEEIGIETELEKFGKFLIHDKNQTEFITLFVGKSDGPFHPNKEEVDEIKAFSLDKVKVTLEKGKYARMFSIMFKAYYKSLSDCCS